jgi:hypothetical protein
MTTTTETAGLTRVEEATGIDVALAEIEAEIRADIEAIDAGPLPQTEDERLAYRVLRYRARVESELARFDACMAAMRMKLVRQLQGIEYVYGPHLRDIAGKMLEGKKAKSVKTPFGTMGFRASPARLEVIDEALVPAWAKETRTTTVVVKAKLNERFETTGEIPDGCAVKDAEQKFFVKV